MPFVAHVQIRNRGTIGGSVCHADPAAELPAVMMAYEAKFVLQSSKGSRVVAAKDFFRGMLTTAVGPGELLAEIRVPALPSKAGWAFDELSRRRGDFALVGVAALVGLGSGGKVDLVRLAFTGVGERPSRAAQTEKALSGQIPDENTVRSAAALCVGDIAPESDLHASADYRRDVAKVMARRVLLKAIERARTGSR
jgi:carbon-monoxide dehydrogenase medium subunit